MSDDKIVALLEQINNKLNSVLPRLNSIEERLDKLDCRMVTNLSELRSISSDLVTDVTSSVKSLGSVSSEISNQSLSDSNPDQEPSTEADKFGIVLSDLGEPEMAANMGQLMNCEVKQLSLFEGQLEFVVIQDSGSMLEKHKEVTTEIVKEITAYVQTLVKVAGDILQLKPGTKVFLGSLTPRFDGRVRQDLVRVFNGLLVTESFLLDDVIVVSQSNLNTRDNKKLFERYEDNLVVLTRYGRTLRVKNVAVQVAQVVPGLTVMRKKKFTPSHHQQGWGGPTVNKKLKTVLSAFLRGL